MRNRNVAHFALREAPAVGGRDQAKRSLLWTSPVDVDPDSQHVLEDRRWGQSVMDTLLAAPRPKAWDVEPMAHSNGQILVGWDAPIR